jgi:site-specific recombinase XerD
VNTPIADHLKPFFHTYLAKQRGVSPHTLKSYRDTFKLFLSYLQSRKRATASLSVMSLDAKTVLAFLEHLEDVHSGRGNSPQTRNQRLAAIQCFFKYLSLHYPALQRHAERIHNIPHKRTQQKTADFMDRKEMDALLTQPRTDTADGIRDLAILTFLYNTGARASEAAQARLPWFDFSNRLVAITGKGNIQRITPLWPSTVQILQLYAKQFRRKPKFGGHDVVFIDQRGLPFTRFGMRTLVKKYLRLAAAQCPNLAARKLSTHSLRHTCAVHLLEARVEPNVIKAWLGHASVSSTEHYLNTDLNTKRRILERFGAPHYVASVLEPKISQSPDQLLDWLKDL